MADRFGLEGPTERFERASRVTAGERAARATAADASAAAAASRAVAAERERTVFVEIGEAVRSAQIVREGATVPVLDLDLELVEEALAGTQRIVNKVVSQSVAAGATVPQGTAVDIVLAPPRRLPIRIIRDAHVVLAERTMGEVFDELVRDNSAVRRAVARNQTADTLTETDRAAITTALRNADVPVSDDEPGRSVDSAFTALQAAFTFGVGG
jgi:hypothetical protein